MELTSLDWAIIAGYFGLTLVVGLVTARRAGKDARGFFLAGSSMPWWLLGVSMVATTFSIDTPNLVAGIVRSDGVAGNWTWWAFVLSGMVTAFVYARLWRRTGAMTDLEFYELRYGGRPAAFLRGFRAVYLGLVFNVVVMAAVTLAAAKLGAIMLGWPGWKTVSVAGAITLVYSGLGGLRAVVLTDFVQFLLAIVGAVWAAIVIVGHERVGGLDALLTHPNVAPKLSLLPAGDAWVALLVIPLCVQWWASYYPGAEPGGGGYIAQRMFSARDERGAVRAVLLFNVAHYALRPWPWILVALASLVVFPEDADLAGAIASDGALSADQVTGDLAYPAMLQLLPAGLVGLVVASLLAAFMSTMSTQVNLGASYLVHDVWGRFIRPDATERQRVVAARVATVLSMVLGCVIGLQMSEAKQVFDILLLLGAGTGAIYLLRWFWWRINAWTEIAAMVGSLAVAIALQHGRFDDVAGSTKVVVGTAVTTLIWIGAALVTPPESDATLQRFVDAARPGGPGWRRFTPSAGASSAPWPVPRGLLAASLGVVAVLGALLGTGEVIYGQTGAGAALLIGAVLAGVAGGRVAPDLGED